MSREYPTRFFDCTLKRVKALPIDPLFQRKLDAVVEEVSYILDDHEELTKLYRKLERENFELKLKYDYTLLGKED